MCVTAVAMKLPIFIRKISKNERKRLEAGCALKTHSPYVDPRCF